MRRIQKFAAINVMAVLIGAAIPAMAQDGYRTYNRGGMQQQTADRHGDREWRDNGHRDFRNDYRADRDRRDYDRGYRQDRRYPDNRGYGYGYGYSYAPGPVYETAPIYVGPTYEGGYYYDRDRYDRRRDERCR